MPGELRRKMNRKGFSEEEGESEVLELSSQEKVEEAKIREQARVGVEVSVQFERFEVEMEWIEL